MSVVSPNDADYIDRISDYQTGFRQLSTDLPLEAPKMTEESSEIIPIGLKQELKQRIANLQANSAFKMLLSIRRIAHLYEEETRLRTRVRLIKSKIEQRDEINRIEVIKMNMLRAERAKASENMVFINSKSIELDSRITTLRSSIREKRSDLNKIKTESIKSGKIILSDYYRTINASRNVDSLSKMVPVIKPQLLTDIKCSSKTKKQMEESSIISESFSIARFLNWSSAIFQYPLRFDANNQFILNHHGLFTFNVKLSINVIQKLVSLAHISHSHISILKLFISFKLIYFIWKDVE